MGILTVGVVTKPFHFEGQRRMRTAEAGIAELHKVVDTLLIIPNQNLFRVANEKTTFADAFAMADQVLYSGVACITDLMVKEGLINLDFADVRAVMREMGKAMMGTGEASGDKRALTAAEAAIANPLIDDSSMKGARGLLISITGGKDLTLFEVDEAATRIREEVDQDANIIVGATFDETLEGVIRVSVVATGIEQALLARNAAAPAATATHAVTSTATPDTRLADLTARLRADNQRLPNAPRSRRRQPGAGGAPPQRVANNVERAALAAIAAAVAPPQPSAPLQPASYGDVTVRPIAQKPSLFPDHDVTRVEMHEPAMPETFIPQAPNAPPLARQGCRNSKICRCLRRTKFGRPVAKSKRSIRKRPGCRCCSASPMSASAVATKRPSRRSRARASGPAMAPMPPLPERKPQRWSRSKSRLNEPVSEYARRPAPQGLDAHGRRHLLHRRHRVTTILISRPSCAGRPTEIVTILTTEKVPATAAGTFVFDRRERCGIQATDIK